MREPTPQEAWINDLLSSTRMGKYRGKEMPFLLAATQYYLKEETADWAKEINDVVFPLMVDVIDEV